MGHGTVHERLEEADVGTMEMAHEIEDRVGIARAVGLVVEQRPARPLRGGLVGRRQPGRVDQGQVGELLRGPADLDAFDRLERQAPEVDIERAVLTPERELLGAGRSQVGHHPIAERVAVPGHDFGAFPGVGRRQPLADEGVEERRLAGLHPAGDGDPERLLEPAQDGGHGRLLVGPACDGQRLVGDAPDVGREIGPGGRQAHASVRTAGPRSCPCPGSPSGRGSRPGCTSASRRRDGR